MGHSPVPVPKEAVMGQVYLLHFLGEGLAHGAQARTRHYLGWSEDAESRIAQHMRGTSGARLMEVVKERGITFTVARVWDNVTREWERKLKNAGGLSRWCPVCKAEGTIPKSRQRTRAEVPAPPPAPPTGPDYAGPEERAGEDFGKASASHRLPKGVRVTVKRERLSGGSDWYIGHIWKDYQYAGHCPVYSELPSKAREAAIDWAWQMFPEEHPGGEKVAYDYKQMFRTILSELGALDRLAARKADVEISAWVNWAKRVLQKRDRITWFLRLGQLKWAEYLADAYQQYKSPGSRAEEARRWREWIKAKAQQEEPPATPEGAVSTHMGAVMARLEHYLSLPIPEIQGTVFLRQQPGEILDRFHRLEKDWRDRQSHFLRPHPRDEGNEADEGDEIVLEFPDGWAWWRLGRSYCPEEARAMGHCGNEAAGPDRPDDRILSLRHKIIVNRETFWEPHLTFIWDDDGLLGEMKGRGNEKPAPRYHPYIVALLERKDLVLGIKGGGYLPGNNFSLEDLPPEQQERVKKANRSLVSASEMYSESRGSMTEELLQRIADRTVLRKDQWRPEEEAFVVDKYANPEWFISTEGSPWLEAQMMLARGGFGKHPNHQVVEEGIRDLLSVLSDSERRAVLERMPPIPGTPLLYRAPSPDAPWRSEDLPSLFMEERNDHALWSYLRGATRILSAPEQQGEYEKLWGILAAAWEAGITREMRQAALDRVRGFLGNNRRNNVRTNDASRVAFPEASDPDFWSKPVLVEVSIQDAVHLASPFSHEESGYSGGEDTAIYIDDYWETSHGAVLYDASAPYKKLTLPSDQKRDLDLKMDRESEGREGRSVRQWHEDFLRGRPYEYLRWLREEVPAIFEQEMTPEAWDEGRAREALMVMLPSLRPQGKG